MASQLLAELTLSIHFGFVLFVVLGGVGVRWWPRLAWVHVPAFVWGSVVNLAGWVCPLTPLENFFRHRAAGEGYEGAFIEHYIAPLVYPGGMTADIALIAGLSLPTWNIAVYAWVWSRRRNPPHGAR